MIIAIKNNTIKMKNRIRARPAKAADMPVKPNRAASNDTTKKIIANVSIFSSCLVTCKMYAKHGGGETGLVLCYFS